MATDRRKFMSLLALGVPASASAMRKGLPFPIHDGIDENVIEQDRESVDGVAGVTNLIWNEKVLIVEDKEKERSTLAKLVTSWGYRVDTARDGVEGLEKATQWSPSIVITDHKMPRMGGIELLGHLAELGQTIAVILVTAHGTIDMAVLAMRMGAYDYMTKPIDIYRLRTKLSNASALLRTHAELEATRRRLGDKAKM